MRMLGLNSLRHPVVPRMVVTEDAIYVAQNDGYIRKYNAVGELDTQFEPIPLHGPDTE